MIDAGSVSQRIEQFDTRHGNDANSVDGWLIFSNGAMRERNPLGALNEPPKDPVERGKVRVRYREVLLQRALQEFKETKHQLLATANVNLQERHTPPPPCGQNDAVQRLKKLQKLVKKCQRDLEAAREELKQSKPDWLVQREAEFAANRESNERFIAALADINV